jgi:hypothetical protein
MFLLFSSDSLAGGIIMKRISIIISHFGLLFVLSIAASTALTAYEFPQKYPSEFLNDQPWMQTQGQTQYLVPQQQYPAAIPQFVQPQYVQLQPQVQYLVPQQQYPAPALQYPAPILQYAQPQYVQPQAQYLVPQATAPAFNYRDLEFDPGRSSHSYLDLELGSPVSTLLYFYPGCIDITAADEKAVGVQRFIQEQVGNGIDSRQFVFFRDHLYEIYVLYGYADEKAVDLMHQKLESIYGKTYMTTSRRSNTETAYFNMIDQYMNYGNNLQVVFTRANAYNNYNYQLGVIMTCFYTNIRVKNEVEQIKAVFRGLPAQAAQVPSTSAW